MANSNPNQKDYFEVSYDLPSENQLVLRPHDRDTEELAAARAEVRRRIVALRFGFASDIAAYGRYITNSVFVVPGSLIDSVKDIIAHYVKRYDRLRQSDEFYTLEQQAGHVLATPRVVELGYKGEYSAIIQDQATEVIEAELKKLLLDLDDRIDKANDKGGIPTRSLKKVNRESGIIVDLAHAFEAAEAQGIKHMLKQLDAKVRLLNEGY